jgi:hypothetical protein
MEGTHKFNKKCIRTVAYELVQYTPDSTAQIQNKKAQSKVIASVATFKNLEVKVHKKCSFK